MHLVHHKSPELSQVDSTQITRDKMNTREIKYISIDAESIERDVKKRMSISWLGSNCGSGVLAFLIELVATPCICISMLFRFCNSIYARTVSIAQYRRTCGAGAMTEMKQLNTLDKGILDF